MLVHNFISFSVHPLKKSVNDRRYQSNQQTQVYYYLDDK
ncbi:hypothetical protein RV10_GL004936 [Enterococcus pallens]|nr:hypothetical protein RV10_GL004936 [Enterococcus pallens]